MRSKYFGGKNMSRIEENEKIICQLGKVKFTNGDAAMLASVLVDISQSLAVIADCLT